VTGRALHALKCWPSAFQAVHEGRKTFEIRLDDRGFEVGDYLRLAEWDPTVERFTGRQLLVRVTYVLSGPEAETFGLRRDHVAMGIEHLGGAL
jgi:hypothetical protein